MRNIGCCASVLLFAALLCGCADSGVPTYPANGRVIFEDGSPVRTGNVECRSLEFGLNARGKIARDGSFTLGTYTADDGAVAGEHQVIVVQFIGSDSFVAEQELGPIEHDHGQPVALRFADYSTSGLKLTIDPDGDNFITLVVGPMKPAEK